jgi:hypothetical protein
MIETSLKLPFLQISPKVWCRGRKLFAETSIFYRVFNFFSYCRTVVVDSHKKIISISVTKWWFFESTETIAFNEVKFIDRSWMETPNSFGFTKDGYGAHDVTEIIYVQLVKHRSSVPVNLFRFIGDGEKYTGFIGVVFGGDSLVDFVGNQNEKSEKYAQLVSKFSGIPLWAEKKRLDRDSLEYAAYCSQCKRQFTTKVSKCIYCGGGCLPNR